MSTDVLVAKDSFSTEINGVPRVVTKGETFREGHPLVEGREELFEPFTVDNDIEDASAAPGRKRRGRRSNTTPEPETPESGSETSQTPAEPADYSGLNMAELKAKLDERGIEYSAPPGTTKASLAELLTAADGAAA